MSAMLTQHAVTRDGRYALQITIFYKTTATTKNGGNCYSPEDLHEILASEKTKAFCSLWINIAIWRACPELWAEAALNDSVGQTHRQTDTHSGGTNTGHWEADLQLKQGR
ncbi:hypothetical protein PoB_000007400 [Plakobranchus ocellatus]|uniref:Uncharacterized protein n=1 Tax=Plakobranchus ocellatus TaxID=259542 RepID=A0AAV3XUY2_9GAST|nr:hypothetical protein PoB_000007400 [Plakobranchus ocellatus]